MLQCGCILNSAKSIHFKSQDTDLLSPGITVNNSHCSSGSNLEASRHLSRSNIDIPRSNGEDPKKQLPRKRSDSSTYELDTIKQHQAFLSR